MRRLSLDWDTKGGQPFFYMLALSWPVSSAQLILQVFFKAKLAFPDTGVALSPSSAAFWKGMGAM